MFVELRHVSFFNKGAQLMLHAMVEAIKRRYKDAKLVMAPSTGFAPYEERAELKLYQKFWWNRAGFQIGYLGGVIPKKMRSLYGVVLDSEIDVVLDASGFLYSEEWGARRTIETAKAVKKWKKQGTKVIFLPQSFGPFASPEIKTAITAIADNADLIFARDDMSMRYMKETAGERENIRQAYDFTNLVAGKVPRAYKPAKRQFCVIPNYRMIDMVPENDKNGYIPFLVRFIHVLLDLDFAPVFLIHEGKDDLFLAEEVNRKLNQEIRVLYYEDARITKGIIGSSYAVLSSRFHGLVSALSQGIPSFATEWSFKYQMLMNDFNFPEGLISVQAGEEEIRQKIAAVLKQDQRDNIVARLQNSVKKHEQHTEEMWSLVYSVIDA